MTAGVINLIIEQGTDYTLPLIWKDENDAPIDVTGFTARMQAREAKASTTTFLDMTTENGQIIMGINDGLITLTLTSAVTTAITAIQGFYDLEIIDGSGLVTRLLEGQMTISQEVTR